MALPRRPIYIQIQDIIRRKIRDRTYLPGTAIPSDVVLAKKYGVSRITVYNAIELLIDEGLLKRVGKIGVFVLGKPDNSSNFTVGNIRALPLLSEDDMPFENIFASVGLEGAQTISEKYYSGYLRPASSEHVELFSIPPNEQVFYQKKVLISEGKPYCLDFSIIPHRYIPTIDRVNFEVLPISEVFMAYGIRIDHVVQEVNISYLSQRDAKFIGATHKTPLLEIDSKFSDYRSKLIEHRQSYVNTDFCSVLCDCVSRNG